MVTKEEQQLLEEHIRAYKSTLQTIKLFERAFPIISLWNIKLVNWVELELNKAQYRLTKHYANIQR